MISEPTSRTVGISISHEVRQTVCASSTQTLSMRRTERMRLMLCRRPSKMNSEPFAAQMEFYSTWNLPFTPGASMCGRSRAYVHCRGSKSGTRGSTECALGAWRFRAEATKQRYMIFRHRVRGKRSRSVRTVEGSAVFRAEQYRRLFVRSLVAITKGEPQHIIDLTGFTVVGVSDGRSVLELQ
jgi:hypothetical protein